MIGCPECGAEVHYRIQGRFTSRRIIMESRTCPGDFKPYVTHDFRCPSWDNLTQRVSPKKRSRARG